MTFSKFIRSDDPDDSASRRPRNSEPADGEDERRGLRSRRREIRADGFRRRPQEGGRRDGVLRWETARCRSGLCGESGNSARREGLTSIGPRRRMVRHRVIVAGVRGSRCSHPRHRRAVWAHRTLVAVTSEKSGGNKRARDYRGDHLQALH